MERRNRRLSCLSLVVFTTWLCIATLVQCAAVVQSGERMSYVPNEYIVRATAGASLSQVEQSVARMGGTVVKALPVANTYLIRIGYASKQSARRSFSSSTVATRWVIEDVQPNFIKYYSAEPNDEYWDAQWGMVSINAPQAWDLVKGTSDVIVAVNDSGAAMNHPDLAGRLIAGWDCVEDDNDPTDTTVGHGTHCAGIIAAQGNNGIGVCGVNWNGVKVLVNRVGDERGLTTDWIISGLDYAMNHGAQVVSMSYGGFYSDPAEHSKLQELASASPPIILVAAAGNESTNLPSYPAAYSEVISVSAIGPEDEIAYYSNYGKIEIAAPGGDDSYGADGMIMSTVLPSQGYYDAWQGTSMACPHVAGAAGLLLSYGIAAADVRDKLLSSARLPKNGGMDATKYGAGILDLQGALTNASVRIVAPGKGATTTTSPDFRFKIQGVSTSTVKIYLDYADIDDNGIPDNPNEGVIADTAFIAEHLKAPNYNEVEFNWLDIAPVVDGVRQMLTAGSHNLCITANSASGGKSVSDWAVFTAARSKITKGIHLCAFPYALDQRMINTPSTVLPGTVFNLGANPRSTLWRYLAVPLSTTSTTPIGYDMYLPGSSVDRVWNNPFTTYSGVTVPTGGGYYYDWMTQERTFAFPAGSGFWLVLPNDVWIDETFPTVDMLPNFDESKGYEVRVYKGYNLVGNPYGHSVPWRTALFTYRGSTKTLLDAESAGWVRSVLFGYSPETSSYVRVNDREALQPFSGYWLYCLVGGPAESDTLVLSILP